MSLIPVIDLNDIPVEKPVPLSGPALTGQLQQKEISGGFVQIRLPLFYFPDYENPENGVRQGNGVVGDLEAFAGVVSTKEEAAEAGLNTFWAKWNLKGEWFTPEFLARLRAGEVDSKEKTAYNINVANLTRKLFQAAFPHQNITIDFDAIIPGLVVGFQARANKENRLEIRTFFPVR